MSNHNKKPVFIVAPYARSGTNYLHDALLSTSVFSYLKFRISNNTTTLFEDYILVHSDVLKAYCEATNAQWKKYGNNILVEKEFDYGNYLMQAIGKGIISSLTNMIEPGKRLLTKTPASSGIHNFFHFFPEAVLLILVRDGRDTVESAFHTFRMPFKRHIYEWRKGSRAILDFISKENKRKNKQWKLIKYEDLFLKTDETVRKLLPILELSDEKIDLEKIGNLPIRGSSTHSRDRQGAVHWEPVKKTKSFSPIGKWGMWQEDKKSIFKAIAGQELIELGYASDEYW
jgi:hypothetical protein